MFDFYWIAVFKAQPLHTAPLHTDDNTEMIVRIEECPTEDLKLIRVDVLRYELNDISTSSSTFCNLTF